MTVSVDGRDPPSSPTLVRRALKIAIPALVLAAVLAFANPRGVLHALRRLSPGAIALAVLILSVDRCMMGLKWWHLLRSAGIGVRLRGAVSIYYQSKFATLVFPAMFGGEVVRGALGACAGVRGHVLVASMIVERPVAAVSSILLAGIGLVYLSTLPSYGRYSGKVVLLVSAASACLAVMALMALHRPAHKLLGRAIRRWIPERVFRFLDRLSGAAVQYKRAPDVLVVNLALAIIEHMLQVLALYVLAIGLGVDFTVVHFLAVTSIVMLVRRGGGFLEGWGIAESGVVMLYTLFGVTVAQSAALALTLWATSLITCLPGGYLLWRGMWRGVMPHRHKSP